MEKPANRNIFDDDDDDDGNAYIPLPQNEPVVVEAPATQDDQIILVPSTDSTDQTQAEKPKMFLDSDDDGEGEYKPTPVETTDPPVAEVPSDATYPPLDEVKKEEEPVDYP